MLLRALFLRPARRKPWRAALTVLGVAAGVGAVVATVAASRAAVASLEEGVEEIAGRALLEITAPGGIDESLLGRLRSVAADAVLAPVVEEVALLPELGDTVRVLGVDPLVDLAARDLEPLPGAPGGPEVFERLLRGEGVLLPEPLATRLGGGAAVVISVRARPAALPVLAVLKPRALSAAWDRVVIADVALVQELFGRHGRLDRIEVVPRGGASTAEIRERVAALLPDGVRVEEPAARGARTGRMVRALEFNLTALSGVSLFVGAVLVATTLATAVVQRRYLIALAVSLGAQRRLIARVVLAEALLIGLAGGVLGVVAGTAGARAALSSVRATVATVAADATAASIRVPPWLALLGVALGVGVSAAAASLPLAEAVRTPPVQNLRAERPWALGRRARRRALLLSVACAAAAFGLTRLPPLHDLPVAALGASLLVLVVLLAAAGPLLDALAAALARPGLRLLGGTPVRLAGAALAAGRRRASWAAGAVGMSVALAVAVGTMVQSFRATVVDWTAQAMRSDLWIRPIAGATGMHAGRLDPELVAIATKLFGADAVDPFHTTEAFVGENPVTLAGGEMTVVARHGGVPFRDGRDSREVFAATAARRGAVVNEPFARRYGVGEGDTVRLTVGTATIERRIEGVFFDYSRHLGMVVLDRADYLSVVPDEGPREIAIFLPEGADPAASRGRLQGALGGRFLVDTLLNAELRREVLAIFDRTFAITRALQAVAAAVAVLAVVTVLFTLVDERRRELALLRALGASPGQVAGVVAAEAGLLGVTGAVGGLGVGLAVGLVLVTVVNVQSFGWTLRFLPPWGDLARTAAWVALACLAAGLAPAIVAGRTTPREGLHDEA